MLKIRQEQLEALRQVPRQAFEDDMVAHFERYFALQATLLGEQRLRTVIRKGIVRAGEHELRTRRQICFYISIMLLLGSEFDVDPQLPWATQRLSDRRMHPSARILRLYDEVSDYLDRTAGKDMRFYNRALLRMRADPLSDLAEDFNHDFEANAVALLFRIYPEKCAVQGEELIRRLVVDGVNGAARYRIRDRDGKLIYSGCMLMTGSRFDIDPAHPWAAEALLDESLPPQDRGSHLYRAAMVYGERMLAGRVAESGSQESTSRAVED